MNQAHFESPEIQAVADFLRNIRPFSDLEGSDLGFAASQVKISYHRAGSQQEILDYNNPTLFIVREGAFDVRSSDGDLLDRVTSGGFFGFISLLTGNAGGNTLSVYEDGLVYRLDKDVFQKLRHRSEPFDHYFTKAFERRLKIGLRSRSENAALATRISAVMSKGFISVDANESILQTVKKMAAESVSSIGILDEAQNLIGIYTDKDSRCRVIAESVDTEQPISSVMTDQPVHVEQDMMVHEATILMMRHRIKHLPVMALGKPVGIVTLNDLIRLQRSDPVLIISEIHRADSTEELVEACEKIPELLLHLIKVEIRADDLGRILTSVTGALTRRLITLAQSKLGPEPVPFVWLAFGSQGRQDQSAKSDQDNGLLLSNSVQAEHDPYFKQLAEFVNHGLDACGYVYCPGDIMAKTDQWRTSLAQWQATFEKWIAEPSSKALMHASIFFDMRAIYTSPGGEELIPQLQDKVLDLAKNNSIFLVLLTQNALGLTPPLGFFKRLVLENNGEHKNTLDIKLRGIMPINDIARIHALANGIKPVNTRDRLSALIEVGALTKHDGENLLDAHEYIAHQRLIHQGQQMADGLAPDNRLKPDNFSALTVQQLKDAFSVVRNSQAGLKLKFSHGLG